MKVKLEGFRELDAELGRLKKATARSAMKRALIEAAQPMARVARQTAPRDDDQLYERIEVSTKVKNEAGKAAFAGVMSSGGTRGDAVAALRSARAGKAFVEVYVGPTIGAPHAHFPEFGTENMAPQPYMRPAFDAEAIPTLERLKVTLSDEITKAITRAARKAARSRG